MSVVRNAREIACRRESADDRLMRIIFEQNSLLRVEFEAGAAQGGMIYRVTQESGQSVELAAEFLGHKVLQWEEDAANRREILLESTDNRPSLIHVVRFAGGHLTVEVAARELETAREISREFVARFERKREKEPERRVCVSFWGDSAPHPE